MISGMRLVGEDACETSAAQPLIFVFFRRKVVNTFIIIAVIVHHSFQTSFFCQDYVHLWNWSCHWLRTRDTILIPLFLAFLWRMRITSYLSICALAASAEAWTNPLKVPSLTTRLQRSAETSSLFSNAKTLHTATSVLRLCVWHRRALGAICANTMTKQDWNPPPNSSAKNLWRSRGGIEDDHNYIYTRSSSVLIDWHRGHSRAWGLRSRSLALAGYSLVKGW